MRRALPAILALGAILAMTLGAAAPKTAFRSPGGGVWYEIFVRSFQDSDGDGIGDLNGVASRLDYLEWLGVDGIWLTPIFASPSYHGYDATDYRAIQPAYGTLDDFDRLVAAAHSRGIRVILDIAVNHTSVHHPWFAQDPRRYVWNPIDPGWPGPDRWFPLNGSFYYGYFGQNMPDLNWRDPEVMSEVQGLLRFWAARGVDGFRLDAARYYVEGPEGEPDTAETHAAIRGFAGAIRAEFPGVFFVGEVWADAATIAPYVAGGDELDLAFDFPAAGGLLGSLKSGLAASFSGAIESTRRRLIEPARLAPFVTNHDMVRVASAVQGDPAALRLAAVAELTLPGTPFLYYGEEVGMPNGALPAHKGDLGKRTPMLWESSGAHGFTGRAAGPWLPFSTEDPRITVEAQRGDPTSLLSAYRELIALRKSTEALSSGALATLPSPAPQVAAYLRVAADGSAALVALNFGAAAVPTLRIALPEAMSGAGALWGEASAALVADGRSLDIGPLPERGAAVVALAPPARGGKPVCR